MPTYTIQERCIVYQTYQVTAETPDAAKAKWDTDHEAPGITKDDDFEWGETSAFVGIYDAFGKPCFTNQWESRDHTEEDA